MRNRPKSLGGAIVFVLVSPGRCVSHTQVSEESDKSVMPWLCLPAFTPVEMPRIDKGVVPSSGVSQEIHFRPEGITKQTGLL